MEQMWAVVCGWMNDSRILVILGLILLDLVLGVGSALKHKVFEWRKLGDFYLTGVLPKLIGYIALHIVIDAVAGVDNIIGSGAQWAAFAVLVASLLGSIAANFKEIYGQELPLPGNG